MTLSCANVQANRSVSDQAAQTKLLNEGEEAATFIRTFVVQAKLNERGNFRKLYLLLAVGHVHCATYILHQAAVNWRRLTEAVCT